MRNVTPRVGLTALWLLPHTQSSAGAQETPSPVAAQDTSGSNDRSVVVTLSGGAGSIGLAAGLSVWASIGNEVDILLRVTETSEFTRFSPSDVLHDFEMLVGLGLTAFGKLNPARSFASLNVGVCLGRQR